MKHITTYKIFESSESTKEICKYLQDIFLELSDVEITILPTIYSVEDNYNYDQQMEFDSTYYSYLYDNTISSSIESAISYVENLNYKIGNIYYTYRQVNGALGLTEKLPDIGTVISCLMITFNKAK
jgi:hypothetical protein